MIHPDGMEVSAVARMIEQDSHILDRMLQIANSRYYGLQRSVDTARRMVVLLGPVTVSGMLVAMDLLKLRDSFDAETESYFLKLMEHSAATAFIARHIAETIRTSPGGSDLVGHQHVGESFATAIVHDFGRIILLFNFPKHVDALYGNLCDETSSISEIRARELDYFGCDHITVGVDFSRALRFPEVAVDAIRHHHDASTARHPQSTLDARMIRVLACAHSAATSMGFGFPCQRSEAESLSDGCWADLAKLDLVDNLPADIAQKTFETKAYVDEYVSVMIG